MSGAGDAIDRAPRAADSARGTRGAGGELRRAAVWMAAGTTVSRVTGLLRIMALAYALGATHLADAYNLANTTPNMLYDIVLGGVLAATFIPVFVDRLATRPEHEAWQAISSIVTISIVAVGVMTLVFWVLAPDVISAFTAFAHSSGTDLAREKEVASTLLRWFVPQVFLYGLIALMTALLNTRRRFAAPMWVPIANNLVVIGVLLWFHHLVPKFPSLAGAQADPGQLVLLGMGTTAGVLLQVVLLAFNLRDTGLGRLRWRWNPRHEAVRTVVRLGGWTFGFVVANQIALYVVLALAVGVPGQDPVSSYTYAYTFMQMPYAVVAVSVMSAVTPDLAERWATGDNEGFRRRLTGGLRATLAIILPASMGMLVLAHPVVALLLGHGTTSVAGTDTTAAALAMFSLGLPGFCAYLYIVRVFQAMQRTKTAFQLYLVENGVNVVLAAALVGPLGVRGLALSLTIAYSVGALAGVAVLRRWLGALGGPHAWSPLRRSMGATAIMGAVVLVVSNVSGADQGLGLFLRVAAAVVAGSVVYVAIAVLLGGRRRALDLLIGQPTGATSGAGADTGAGAAREPRGRRAPPSGRAPLARTRVEESPRIRIVPAPGIPGDVGTGAVPSVPGMSGFGAPERAAPPPPVPPAVPPASRRAQRPLSPPDARTRPPRRRRRAPAGRAERPDTQGRPVPPATDDDVQDDPGERRWLGGTHTSLPPRRPR